ncbi:hypothetical protein SK128_001398 [Halocaridina rubra]|uniref:U3 small nucleolar RNA-associated protein 25 homolog n=1 Tax=Halocaridina rubra TaxID=373956 RepID=A0AAN9A193_HALRR
MVRNQFRGKRGRKRKNDMKEFANRKQYEEFGEAHPVEENSNMKCRRIEDAEERDDGHNLSDDEISSSNEPEDTDAISMLLSTFKTNSNTAIDSDDEDSDEGDSNNTDEEDSENSNESEYEEVLDIDKDSTSSDSDNISANTNSDYEEDTSNENSNVERVSKDICNKTEGQKANDEDLEDDADETLEKEDPFSKHFELSLDAESAEMVQKSEFWTSSFEEWPILKRIKFDLPQVKANQPKPLLLVYDEGDSILPNIGSIPKPPSSKNYNLADCHILQPLRNNVSILNEETCSTGFTERQKEIFAILSNYSDFYYPEATHEKYEEIRTVYAVHVINHVLKTRKKVLRHNSKLQKSKAKKNKKERDLCYRDQGYTRPKVLILLPFKHSAYRVVEIMSALLHGKNFDVLRQSRFHEEYGPEENQEPMKKLNRGEDFHEIFTGNSNEEFKLGIKVTKQTLKLYTGFFESDIIIASPLGLRCLMGTTDLESDEIDFLTSIEVLIIDQADVLLMQNWEHILILMEFMNKPPHNIHKLDTDLSRIRMWTLDGYAAMYRQTVLFASTHIDHNRAVINKCKTFTGRVQVLNAVKAGTVQEIVAEAELILTRVVGMRDPDARFKYFVNEVLPQYKGNRRIGVMVYIPDYCDYVRLVKHLKDDGGTSFTSINEYLSGETAKLAKRRSDFFDGKKQFMLYTERFHFYRRYRIKGVRHVIFYELPTYPHFFSEVCNLMVTGNQNRRTQKRHIGNSTATVLYQQSDITKLIGILGSHRAGAIIKAQKKVHVCVLGS